MTTRDVVARLRQTKDVPGVSCDMMDSIDIAISALEKQAEAEAAPAHKENKAMTTRELEELKRLRGICNGEIWQPLQKSALDAAIAALEKQAEAEQPKRLAPFPWRAGPGSCDILDANGKRVCVAMGESGGDYDKEVVAHILAHSQGEPVNPPPVPGVDPAAVRCAEHCFSQSDGDDKYHRERISPIISRTLNLPEIRRIAESLQISNILGQTAGDRILACLDGKGDA